MAPAIGGRFVQIDGAGEVLVWEGSDDPTGGNPDAGIEVFALDLARGPIVQVSPGMAPGMGNAFPDLSADGRTVVYLDRSDPFGTNPDGGLEAFVYDRTTGVLRQTTASEGGAGTFRTRLSGDASVLAAIAEADLTGENPDRSTELFRSTDGGATFRQITQYDRGFLTGPAISLDGSKIAFSGTADLTGQNPDGNQELFLYDASTERLLQLTHTASCSSLPASDWGAAFDGSGSLLLFLSDCDHVGQNADGGYEAFVADAEGELRQLSSGDADTFGVAISANGARVVLQRQSLEGGEPEILLFDLESGETTLVATGRDGALDASGARLAFSSSSDPLGTNPDHNREVYVADCPLPPARSVLLQRDRYLARTRWRVGGGSWRRAAALPLTADTGVFWFFEPGNLEVLVKVLDGCSLNDHRWVFATGLTDVAVELSITDTYTGEVRSYGNEKGDPFPPIRDVTAFTGCTASSGPAASRECPAGGPRFTSRPFEIDRAYGIVPLGSVNPPDHTVPVHHSYVYVTRPGELGSARSTEVFAPEPMTLVGAIRYSATDYELHLQPCRDVRYYVIHLSRLAPEILAAVSEFDDLCLRGFCIERADLEVREGQTLGVVLGSERLAFDVGLVDHRRPALGFVAPSRYRLPAELLAGLTPQQIALAGRVAPDDLHQYCPWEYFVPALEQALVRLLGAADGERRRSASPVCGTHQHDIAGTAQGNWFGSASDTVYSEDNGVALVRDAVRPEVPLFSVGRRVPGLGSGAYRFDPGDPTRGVNVDFAEVGEGRVLCYEHLRRVETPLPGILLLELFSSGAARADRLRIEYRRAVAECAAAGPAIFSGTAVVFER